MFKIWKKNTVYITIMQVILLIINFFVITVISRNYGASIYGEYASAKSLSVLIGTLTVMSLALVVTRVSSKTNSFDKILFFNTYKLILKNSSVGILLAIPIAIFFGRNTLYVIVFLVGFIFNELIHISLAYFQAKGDFVLSSKQITIRTIIYGIGAWFIVNQKFNIFWVILFQTVVLLVFFIISYFSLPRSKFGGQKKYNQLDIFNSGKKMVLTTFAAALISEFDIVVIGLFYQGSILGILAWSRRLLEGLYQLIGASLDIVFPELTKLTDKNQFISIRSKLKKVFYLSFAFPLLYLTIIDLADEVFVNVLGLEFSTLSEIFSIVLFGLPFMLWTRINIIFARALHLEIQLSKTIAYASLIGLFFYFINSKLNLLNIEFIILISQILFASFTNIMIGKKINEFGANY